MLLLLYRNTKSAQENFHFLSFKELRVQKRKLGNFPFSY